MMKLAEYFEKAEGMGVLATSDIEGNVDAAIYARPYVIDEETIVFSMLERLSHLNIETNPKAAYLFIEKGPGYRGRRLYLVACGEEADPKRIAEIKKQHPLGLGPRRHKSDEPNKHFVYFKVTKIRPLVGDGPQQT